MEFNTCDLNDNLVNIPDATFRCDNIFIADMVNDEGRRREMGIYNVYVNSFV